MYPHGVTIRLSQRSARVVGGIGRALIGFGVVTLLFVGYQLWGTSIQHARAQDQMSSQFEARLAEVGTGPAEVPSAPSGPERGIGASRPIAFDGVTATPPTTEPVDPEVLAALAPVHGEPVAQIEIPAIGVSETVVYGIGVADLRKGPGVFPDNSMPGTSGNAAIAGHRTTYGAPFHDIDQLEPGDEIVVQTLAGAFTYEVMAHPDPDGGERGHFIVPPTAVEVLADLGDDRLTLVACHPKWSDRERIIVTALLVEDPVELPELVPVDPDDDSAPVDVGLSTGWGDGLEGDGDALVPTVAWGGLFLLGLGGAWGAGRVWRRWPAYAMSAPLVVWFLWTWFVHLDRFLPSY